MRIEGPDDNPEQSNNEGGGTNLPISPSLRFRIAWTNEVKDTLRFRFAYDLMVAPLQPAYSRSTLLPSLGKEIINGSPYESLCLELTSCVQEINKFEAAPSLNRREPSELGLPPWFTGEWLEITEKLRKYEKDKVAKTLDKHISEMNKFAQSYPSTNNSLQSILQKVRMTLGQVLEGVFRDEMANFPQIAKSKFPLIKSITEDQINSLDKPLLDFGSNWEEILRRYSFGFGQ